MRVKDLLEELEKDEKLSGLLSPVPKKYRKTQSDLLFVWNRLAYFHFLADDIPLASYLADQLIRLDFRGDYRYWTPVEYSALLLAYLDQDKAEEVMKRILAAQNEGSEDIVFGKKKVHRRFLQGVHLAKLEAEVDAAKTEALQMNKRLILLFHLLYLRLFADEAVLSAELINQKTAANCALLSSYIKKEGMNQLYPFK